MLNAGEAGRLLEDDGFPSLERYLLVMPEWLRAMFGAWVERLSRFAAPGGHEAVFAQRPGVATRPITRTADAKS